MKEDIGARKTSEESHPIEEAETIDAIDHDEADTIDSTEAVFARAEVDIGNPRIASPVGHKHGRNHRDRDVCHRRRRAARGSSTCTSQRPSWRTLDAPIFGHCDHATGKPAVWPPSETTTAAGASKTLQTSLELRNRGGGDLQLPIWHLPQPVEDVTTRPRRLGHFWNLSDKAEIQTAAVTVTGCLDLDDQGNSG